jgi:VanZ family protein
MSRTLAGFTSYTLPVILFSLFIFLISALSHPPAPDFNFEWGDKINHAGAFGIMMLLAFRAARWLLPNHSPRVQIAMAFLYCILYGATDEIHQAYVPNRQADIYDWIADAVGASLAAVTAMMIQRTWLAKVLFGRF